MDIKFTTNQSEWANQMPPSTFDPNEDKSKPSNRGKMGPDWRNSEYYRGNSSEMADMVWHLKSQLTEVQRENQILRLQLNQIKSILAVE